MVALQINRKSALLATTAFMATATLAPASAWAVCTTTPAAMGEPVIVDCDANEGAQAFNVDGDGLRINLENTATLTSLTVTGDPDHGQLTINNNGDLQAAGPLSTVLSATGQSTSAAVISNVGDIIGQIAVNSFNTATVSNVATGVIDGVVQINADDTGSFSNAGVFNAETFGDGVNISAEGDVSLANTSTGTMQTGATSAEYGIRLTSDGSETVNTFTNLTMGDTVGSRSVDVVSATGGTATVQNDGTISDVDILDVNGQLGATVNNTSSDTLEAASIDIDAGDVLTDTSTENSVTNTTPTGQTVVQTIANSSSTQKVVAGDATFDNSGATLASSVDVTTQSGTATLANSGTLQEADDGTGSVDIDVDAGATLSSSGSTSDVTVTTTTMGGDVRNQTETTTTSSSTATAGNAAVTNAEGGTIDASDVNVDGNSTASVNNAGTLLVENNINVDAFGQSTSSTDSVSDDQTFEGGVTLVSRDRTRAFAQTQTRSGTASFTNSGAVGADDAVVNNVNVTSYGGSSVSNSGTVYTDDMFLNATGVWERSQTSDDTDTFSLTEIVDGDTTTTTTSSTDVDQDATTYTVGTPVSSSVTNAADALLSVGAPTTLDINAGSSVTNSTSLDSFTSDVVVTVVDGMDEDVTTTQTDTVDVLNTSTNEIGVAGNAVFTNDGMTYTPTVDMDALGGGNATLTNTGTLAGSADMGGGADPVDVFLTARDAFTVNSFDDMTTVSRTDVFTDFTDPMATDTTVSSATTTRVESDRFGSARLAGGDAILNSSGTLVGDDISIQGFSNANFVNSGAATADSININADAGSEFLDEFDRTTVTESSGPGFLLTDSITTDTVRVDRNQFNRGGSALLSNAAGGTIGTAMDGVDSISILGTTGTHLLNDGTLYSDGTIFITNDAQYTQLFTDTTSSVSNTADGDVDSDTVDMVTTTVTTSSDNDTSETVGAFENIVDAVGDATFVSGADSMSILGNQLVVDSNVFVSSSNSGSVFNTSFNQTLTEVDSDITDGDVRTITDNETTVRTDSTTSGSSSTTRGQDVGGNSIFNNGGMMGIDSTLTVIGTTGVQFINSGTLGQDAMVMDSLNPVGFINLDAINRLQASDSTSQTVTTNDNNIALTDVTVIETTGADSTTTLTQTDMSTLVQTVDSTSSSTTDNLNDGGNGSFDNSGSIVSNSSIDLFSYGTSTFDNTGSIVAAGNVNVQSFATQVLNTSETANSSTTTDTIDNELVDITEIVGADTTVTDRNTINETEVVAIDNSTISNNSTTQLDRGVDFNNGGSLTANSIFLDGPGGIDINNAGSTELSSSFTARNIFDRNTTNEDINTTVDSHTTVTDTFSETVTATVDGDTTVTTNTTDMSTFDRDITTVDTDNDTNTATGNALAFTNSGTFDVFRADLDTGGDLSVMNTGMLITDSQFTLGTDGQLNTSDTRTVETNTVTDEDTNNATETVLDPDGSLTTDTNNLFTHTQSVTQNTTELDTDTPVVAPIVFDNGAGGNATIGDDLIIDGAGLITISNAGNLTIEDDLNVDAFGTESIFDSTSEIVTDTFISNSNVFTALDAADPDDDTLDQTRVDISNSTVTENSTVANTSRAISGGILLDNDGTLTLSRGTLEAGGTDRTTTTVTDTVTVDDQTITNNTLIDDAGTDADGVNMRETVELDSLNGTVTTSQTEVGVAGDITVDSSGTIDILNTMTVNANGGGNAVFNSSSDIASNLPAVNDSPGFINLNASDSVDTFTDIQSFDRSITTTTTNADTADVMVPDVRTVVGSIGYTQDREDADMDIGGTGMFTNSSALDGAATVNSDGNATADNSGRMRGNMTANAGGFMSVSTTDRMEMDVFEASGSFGGVSTGSGSCGNRLSGDLSYTSRDCDVTVTETSADTALGSTANVVNTGEIGSSMTASGQGDSSATNSGTIGVDGTTPGSVFGGDVSVNTNAFDSTFTSTDTYAEDVTNGGLNILRVETSMSVSTEMNVAGVATGVNEASGIVRDDFRVNGDGGALFTNSGWVSGIASAFSEEYDYTDTEMDMSTTSTEISSDMDAGTTTTVVVNNTSSSDVETELASSGDATATNNVGAVVGGNSGSLEAQSLTNALVTNNGTAENIEAFVQNNVMDTDTDTFASNSTVTTVVDDATMNTLTRNTVTSETDTRDIMTMSSAGDATVVNTGLTGLIDINAGNGQAALIDGRTDIRGGATANYTNTATGETLNDVFVDSLKTTFNSTFEEITNTEVAEDFVANTRMTTETVSLNTTSQTVREGGTTTVLNDGLVGRTFVDLGVTSPDGTGGDLEGEGADVSIINNGTVMSSASGGNGRIIASGNSSQSSSVTTAASSDEITTTADAADDLLETAFPFSRTLTENSVTTSTSETGGNGVIAVTNNGTAEGGVIIDGNGADSVVFNNTGIIGTDTIEGTVQISNTGSMSTTVTTVDRVLTEEQPSAADISVSDVTTTVVDAMSMNVYNPVELINDQLLTADVTISGVPATLTNNAGSQVTGDTTVRALFDGAMTTTLTETVETSRRSTAGVTETDTVTSRTTTSRTKGGAGLITNRGTLGDGFAPSFGDDDVTVSGLTTATFINETNVSMVMGNVSASSRSRDEDTTATPTSLSDTRWNVGGLAVISNDGIIMDDATADGVAQSYLVNTNLIGGRATVGSTSESSWTRFENVDGVVTETIVGLDAVPTDVTLMDVPAPFVAALGVDTLDALNTSVTVNMGEIDQGLSAGSVDATLVYNTGEINGVNLYAFGEGAETVPDGTPNGFFNDGGVSVLINNDGVINSNVNAFHGNTLINHMGDGGRIDGDITFNGPGTWNTVNISGGADIGRVSSSGTPFDGSIIAATDSVTKENITNTVVNWDVAADDTEHFPGVGLGLTELNKTGAGKLVLWNTEDVLPIVSDEASYDIDDINVNAGILQFNAAQEILTQDGSSFSSVPTSEIVSFYNDLFIGNFNIGDINFDGDFFDPQQKVLVRGDVNVANGASVYGEAYIIGNVNNAGTFAPGFFVDQPDNQLDSVTQFGGQAYVKADVNITGDYAVSGDGSHMIYAAPTLNRVVIPETLTTINEIFDAPQFGITTSVFEAGVAATGVTHVDGDLTLAGSLDVALREFTLYTGNESYVFAEVGGTLDATGSSVTVIGDQVSPYLSASISTATGANGETIASVDINRASYAMMAGGGNQAAIAAGLDGALQPTVDAILNDTFASNAERNAAQGLASFFTALDFASQESAQAAFSSLDGQFYASLNSINPAMGFLDLSTNRLAGLQLRNGVGRGQNQISLWASAYANSNDLEGGDGIFGINSSTNGLSGGIDIQLDRDLIVGVAIGQSDINASSDSRPESARIDSTQAGIYVGGAFDVFENSDTFRDGALLRVGAQMAYVWTDFDVERTLSGFDQSTRAEYNGNEWQMAGYLALDLPVSDDRVNPVIVTPQIDLLYRSRDVDAFVEQGGPLGLNVEENDGSIFSARFSVALEKTFAVDENISITPRASVGYQLEGNPDEEINAGFVGGGTTFELQGAETDDAFVPTAGVNVQWNNVGIFLNYMGHFGGDQTSHGIRGGLGLSF